MANVTTIDKTPNTGSATFPLQANEFYGLVETIASQNIRNAISTNRIVDGFYNYDVTDGSVLRNRCSPTRARPTSNPLTPFCM